MYPLDEYRADALALDLGPFTDKYASHFLVHITSQGVGWDEDLQWATLQSRKALTNADAEPTGSWAVPIVKRPGNPHPDRISIGRARSCDIVLRYNYISKLHAYLLVKDGRHRLRDLDSTYGSKVNNVPLPRGDSVRLETGDRITLGELGVRYITAATLHAQLRAPAPPASSRAFGRGRNEP